MLYLDLHRIDEAGPVFVQNLEAQRQVLGQGHPDTLRAQANLSGFYLSRERFAKAALLVEKGLEQSRTGLGSRHGPTQLYLVLMIK